MQSSWIGFFGILCIVCSLVQGVPVDVTKTDVGAETRIIIPPELPPHHFELLKEKSDKQENRTKNPADDESTPLNFLRNEDMKQNASVFELKPVVLFGGSKQTPIYITIPIYITTSLQPPQALPVNHGTGMPAAALRNGPGVPEEPEITTSDIKQAFIELVRDVYKREGRPYRGKRKNYKRNSVKTDHRKQ